MSVSHIIVKIRIKYCLYILILFIFSYSFLRSSVRHDGVSCSLNRRTELNDKFPSSELSRKRSSNTILSQSKSSQSILRQTLVYILIYIILLPPGCIMRLTTLKRDPNTGILMSIFVFFFLMFAVSVYLLTVFKV